MEGVLHIAQYASAVSGICTALLLLIKPFREWLTGTREFREGQRCLLRKDMLSTYYRNKDKRTIRQFEYENFELEYKAYKALRGNSFIDRIHDEVKKWEVIS